MRRIYNPQLPKAVGTYDKFLVGRIIDNEFHVCEGAYDYKDALKAKTVLNEHEELCGRKPVYKIIQREELPYEDCPDCKVGCCKAPWHHVGTTCPHCGMEG